MKKKNRSIKISDKIIIDDFEPIDLEKIKKEYLVKSLAYRHDKLIIKTRKNTEEKK